MKNPVQTIRKTLSPNDVGETSTHQAGILVPKTGGVLGFFPKLHRETKNPRCTLVFIDEDGVTRWPFEFIYYNNSQLGGTRNEYRLTGMTRYIRSKNLKAGSEIFLSKDDEGRLYISAGRGTAVTTEGPLKLSAGWKVVRIKP